MKIPYYKQKTEYTCGPASVRMALASMDIKRTEEQISKMLHTNKRVGTWHKYIPVLAERFKLDYIVQREGSISTIKKLWKQKWRIIVCYRDKDNYPHYSVVKKIGFFKIHLLDPHSTPNKKIAIRHFKRIWYDGENHQPWFVALKKARQNKHIKILQT